MGRALEFKVKRPLIYKLILSITIPLCLVYSITLGIGYKLNKDYAQKSSEMYLMELCSHYASGLDSNLREVMQQTNNLANLIELSHPINRSILVEYLRRNVEQNQFLSGFAFAFEPDPTSSKSKLYCPYLCRNDSTIALLNVADSYDYTRSDWYTAPRKSSQSMWTEPYMGGASGIMNATFTVPVSKQGHFLGVAAADLSLTGITKELSDLKLMGAYVFLVSKQGTFISHPNPDWIMHQSLDSIAASGKVEFEGLNSLLQQTSEGILKLNSDTEDNAQWLVYKRIASTDWTFAAVISEATVMAGVRRQLFSQLLLMCIGLALIIILIVGTSVSITTPLRQLTKRAHQISEGDLETKLPANNGKDEIQELARVFETMTIELKKQILNVTVMAEAKARVESELSIARQIQESLLPRVFPPFPQRTEFSLYAQMIPAREVAGDFYDFFFLDQNRLVLIIADVSGKGIPAALFMAVTRTLLKTACDVDTSASQALMKVNRILSKDNDNCMFTTLFIGIYHVDNGTLCYANAGHLAPLLFSRDGTYCSIDLLGDPALGIIEEHVYRESCFQIEIGDRLVFYTDGVSEALDKQNNLYGLDRFIDLLKSSLDDPIEAVQGKLQDDLIKYQDGDLADDITMLFFGRKS